MWCFKNDIWLSKHEEDMEHACCKSSWLLNLNSIRTECSILYQLKGLYCTWAPRYRLGCFVVRSGKGILPSGIVVAKLCQISS